MNPAWLKAPLNKIIADMKFEAVRDATVGNTLIVHRIAA